MKCEFKEGIDECHETKCDKNIMGMCAKKGSKNYPDIPKRTNFEKIKLMNIDELAEFMSNQLVVCPLNDYVCEPCEYCDDCIKRWLESEVEE